MAHHFIKRLFRSLQPHLYVTAVERDAAGIDTRIIAIADRKSDIAEQYRTLHTAFEMLCAERKARAVVITSAEKEEGKTITSCNLAVMLASEIGRKTLLVDGDLRKPEIHTLFNLKKSPGLSDLLSGKASVDDILKAPAVRDLYILPAGSVSSNPSELLRRPEAKELIAKLKLRFDHIIIDTPPIMPVSDSRIIGGFCDGVIMVVRSDATSMKVIHDAFWLMETAHVKPMACILTGNENPFYANLGYKSYHHEDEGQGITAG